MKQIDQDPGDYRIQKPDGTWGYRVNRPLCRWMGIIGLGFAAFLGWKFASEGNSFTDAMLFAAVGFASGSLITMSFRSID